MGPTINLKIGRRELAKAWARRLRRGVGGGGGGRKISLDPLRRRRERKTSAQLTLGSSSAPKMVRYVYKISYAFSYNSQLSSNICTEYNLTLQVSEGSAIPMPDIESTLTYAKLWEEDEEEEFISLPMM